MGKYISRQTVLRLLFASILLSVLALTIDIDKTLRTIFPDYMVAIGWTLVPILGAIAVMAYRHAKLLSDYLPPYGHVLSAVILSAGFNYILPSRLAELLKATYLREKCYVPFSAGASAVIMERLVDMLIVGVVGALSILLLPNYGSAWKYVVISCAIASIFFILPHLGSFIRFFTAKLPWPAIKRFLNRFQEEIENKTRLKLLYMNIGLGVAAWSLNIIAFAVFFNLATNEGLSLQGVFVVFVASAIGIAMPILPGGLGTFEAAIVLALSPYGFTLDESIALAIAFRITLIIAVAPVAVLIWLRSGTGTRSFLANVRSALKSDK